MENVTFKTHPIKWWQSLFTMYFGIVKGKRLTELSIQNDQITIETQKGKKFSAPFKDVKVRYHKDQYQRYWFTVSYAEQKVSFVLVSYIMSDEEVEQLKDLLMSVQNVDESATAKAEKALDKLKEIMEWFS